MAPKNTTPTPTPEKPNVDAAKMGEHVVQPGETLADIAAKYTIGIDVLARRNGLHVGFRNPKPGVVIYLYENKPAV